MQQLHKSTFILICQGILGYWSNLSPQNQPDYFWSDSVYTHTARISWEDRPEIDGPTIAFMSVERCIQHLNDRNAYVRSRLIYKLMQTAVVDPDFGSIRITRIPTIEMVAQRPEDLIKPDKIDCLRETWSQLREINERPIDAVAEPEALAETVRSAMLISVI